jgi:uncharacterized phiE125 gp8 family phage protein
MRTTYANPFPVYDSFSRHSRPTLFPSDVQVTVDPVGQVVTSETVGFALPSYNTGNNTFIALIVKAVTEQVEKYIGRDLLSRTRKAVYFNPSNMVYLTPVPVASITSVKMLDDDGTAYDMTLNTDYYVRGLRDNVQITDITYARGRYLEVVYTTGYGDADDVPDAIKLAVVQEAARQYKNRQDPEQAGSRLDGNFAPETIALLKPYIVRRV